MAMDVGGSKGSLKADINVTPLVDVMLVLLIIMMLIAPMLQKGVNVQLPLAANTLSKPDNQTQTVVAVDAANKLWINGLAGPEGGVRRPDQDAPRRQDRSHRPHQGGPGRVVLRDHAGDGLPPRGADRGHRIDHRPEDGPEQAGAGR